VNLFKALDRMERTLQSCRADDDLAAALLKEARSIHREDVEACRRIGELGAALLRPGTSVLTHCNAGALATTGIGTAIGVIVAAHRQGKIRRVYAGETRPLLQGARLTTFELLRAGIDTTLITDSAAGLVMSRGLVQAVVVGADRIAANGDTANKIGTYPLAVLADRHNVPFYVAAPSSTIDPSTAAGDAIIIEERDPAEVTRIGSVSIAPEGVQVYAPAFDITPNELITAIVTETGVLVPPFSRSMAGS
ncbi:MAG TPA: S-methyl-5-thioribose-1-phosphate isomerase, partial [Bacteroidota bacterium]